MAQSIERELKSLLHAADYQRLRRHFFSEQEPFTQTNYYYDTPENHLKKAHCGLRIRILDTHAEATLKSPQADTQPGLIETTDSLPWNFATKSLAAPNFPSEHTPSIKAALAKLLPAPENLAQIGYLKTCRLERQLTPDVLLVLDESWYQNGHDFELEMEFSAEIAANDYFTAFLHKYALDYQAAPNKIQRMMAAK